MPGWVHSSAASRCTDSGTQRSSRIRRVPGSATRSDGGESVGGPVLAAAAVDEALANSRVDLPRAPVWEAPSPSTPAAGGVGPAARDAVSARRPPVEEGSDAPGAPPSYGAGRAPAAARHEERYRRSAHTEPEQGRTAPATSKPAARASALPAAEAFEAPASVGRLKAALPRAPHSNGQPLVDGARPHHRGEAAAPAGRHVRIAEPDTPACAPGLERHRTTSRHVNGCDDGLRQRPSVHRARIERGRRARQSGETQQHRGGEGRGGRCSRLRNHPRVSQARVAACRWLPRARAGVIEAPMPPHGHTAGAHVWSPAQLDAP